jgi:exodeoxyribonuclease-5
MSTPLATDLLKKLKINFPFAPTRGQVKALEKIATFCLSSQGNEVFMLKGYAGTGKTSLINTLVKTLPSISYKIALLAPTGRAAKVMAQYSGHMAFTIHKFIYVPSQNSFGAAIFNLRANKGRNAIFIVDEASMIADTASEVSGSLLADLLQFVSTGINCKIIFVGDLAQLPPVHTDESPALNADYLLRHYGQESIETELTEVMRQVEGSVLLQNATHLRQEQKLETLTLPKFKTGPDFIWLTEGYEVEEALNDSFARAGREGTTLIVRANKRANEYNQQIRQRILWQEEEISTGDYLMVVKNNYHWLPKKSKAGFIANGDIVELLEIYEIKELYGFRFARVKVQMVDYPQEPPFETVIFLDVLTLPAAALPWNDSKEFYNRILLDYADEPSKFKRHQLVRQNPYFNALQVKFAYAITCHKAQGGQWQNVFIEKPWLPTEEIPIEYLRWLYTAITRATEKVYLIGFTADYFVGD